MTNKKMHKLLFVDDDKITLAIYEHLFSRLFEVAIAENGSGALRILDTRIFHAVITDINMPDISGIELTRKIRSSATLNNRAIIIGVTATPHSIAGEAVAAGMNKLFAKPTEFPEIQAYLNKTFRELGY